MILSEIIQHGVNFVQQHRDWSLPIVFFLACAESLVIISLLFPATTLLIGIGFLIGRSELDFWSIWGVAALGASLGDWISYWLGCHYSQLIIHAWPLRNRRDFVPKGVAFFQRWGLVGIFVGRFTGPLRAVVPFVAGICTLPFWSFQLVNILSALVWAFVVLAPGAWGAHWLAQWL